MEIVVRDHNTRKGKVWHWIHDNYYYHREDGPAVMFDDGKDYMWYYYNKVYQRPEEMPLNLFLAYVKWKFQNAS